MINKKPFAFQGVDGHIYQCRPYKGAMWFFLQEEGVWLPMIEVSEQRVKEAWELEIKTEKV